MNQKKEIIELLIKEFQGKEMEEVLPNLISISKSLTNANITFTSDDIQLILKEFSNTISPKEKKIIETILLLQQ